MKVRSNQRSDKIVFESAATQQFASKLKKLLQSNKKSYSLYIKEKQEVKKTETQQIMTITLS